VTRIKICGIVRVADALAAVAAGADALGFVFDASPRRIEPEAARAIVRRLPPFVRTVGVFRESGPETVREIARRAEIDVVQLHGDEPAPFDLDLGLPLVRRFRVAEDDTPERLRARLAAYERSSVLLDPGTGSGVSFRWEIARGLPGCVIVAGGLDPSSVGRAVRAARPYAVDVSSGVEEAPGIKSDAKMRAFVAAVRSEDDRNLA
jgi:phosphoribosylanthranilate isomerase